MRLLTHRGGDLSTYFDIIDRIECGVNISSLKQILNNNHTEDNRSFIGDRLLLKSRFRVCKSFKKVTRCLGFELELKESTRKRNIIHTIPGVRVVNVTIGRLSLDTPTIIASPETPIFLTKLLRIVSHYLLNHGQPIENLSTEAKVFILMSAHH